MAKVTFYGLWSEARKVWWTDRAGVVFFTISQNVAAAQLSAVLGEARQLSRAADWIVAPIEPGEPA